tara:strand:+ start:628 stop:990 length:363 start_codon:yes stop_codon:yes gene_type:complete
MKKAAFLLVISLFGVINSSLAGGVPQSAGEEPAKTIPDLADIERIAEGKEIFHSTCADYCHGHEPAVFIGRGDELMPNYIYETIFKGGQGATPMPPWGEVFDEQEIWSLVAYIKYLGTAE